MKIIKEFKEFALKGNVVDMAVGVIIGGAFKSIVDSMVNDIIMPLVSTLMTDVNFSDLSVVLKTSGENVITLNYGNFIQVVLNFIIVAASIFAAVKAINSLKRKKEEEPAPAPEEPKESDELKALNKIVELLEKQ